MVGQEAGIVKRTRVAGIDQLALLAPDPAALPAAVEVPAAVGNGSAADHPRVQALSLLAADDVASAPVHRVVVPRWQQQRLTASKLFSQLGCQTVVPVKLGFNTCVIKEPMLTMNIEGEHRVVFLHCGDLLAGIQLAALVRASSRVGAATERSAIGAEL